MAKKLKNKNFPSKKNSLANSKNKKNIKNNQKSIKKNKKFKIEYIIKKNKTYKFSDTQKQIIKKVIKNKSQLNYYLSDFQFSQELLKLADKVKNSCLCIVSEIFGTAVCISEKGYILSCEHAAPPFKEDKIKTDISILIFPNGTIVKAKTIFKNVKIDLALLKIIEIFSDEKKFIKVTNQNKFPYAKINFKENEININNENPKKNTKIFCIGNPSFECPDVDLNKFYKEYKPFWLSKGEIKGYMKNEIYGEKDLGPLIHSCWTYWGHSGAPIFNYEGELIGLHNIWDENNGNRHGVSLMGIIKFLKESGNLII